MPNFSSTSFFGIFFSTINSCCIYYIIISLNNRSSSKCSNGINTSRQCNGVLSLVLSETFEIPNSTTSTVEKTLSSSTASICDTEVIQDTNTKQQPRWLSWNTAANKTSTRCNITRLNYEELQERFGSMGIPALYPQPLVLESKREWNEQFRSLTSYHNITKFFDEEFLVTLSTSNSFSSFRRSTTLSQYLNNVEILGEVNPQEFSNETWYLFGETFSKEWKGLLQLYQLPPCVACTEELSALSFGIGNRAGSGVQWHFHGPGFSETLHGRKHWILYPPSYQPSYDPDATSLHWMEYTYPSLAPDHRPWECTVHSGELIYFPDGWYHATINLDPYTAFLSTFTRDHDMELT